MRITIFLTFILLAGPLWADQDNRYLEEGKVLYENPLEQDVLKVKVSLGYCTVLEFPEKPVLVTVGDNSLIQVEIPQNSKSVVVKPLQEAGETNLFVFTPSKRFNYQVTIGDTAQVDYVVASKETARPNNKGATKLPMGELLRMAKSYDFLKHVGAINSREFIQKDLFYQCAYSKLNIDVIEAFTHQDPHYLVLHIVVHNLTDVKVGLTERSTNIFINDQKFAPQYVLFDRDQLSPMSKTDGWLIFENSFVSIDNKFSLVVGVEDEEYVCKQSVS